jgi:FHA domain-containing protein/cysteine-rich secretory family protein
MPKAVANCGARLCYVTRAMAAPIRLVALGSASLRAYPLAKKQITIGSAPDNDVVIEHNSVSRRHAVIVRGIGRFAVRDLDSTNGTRINGRRIAGARRVAPGDELQFGNIRFAVLNSPRRRRLSTGGIAAMLALVVLAGFGVARYFNVPPMRSFIGPSSAVSPPPTGSPPAAVAERMPPAPDTRDGPSVVAPEAGHGGPPTALSTAPGWLRAVNEYRAMAGQPAVHENPVLSAGDFAHARYLVKNVGSPALGKTEGADAHNEQRGNRWFSSEGLRAARSGDIDQWWDANPRSHPPPNWAIEHWVASTWHRMAILNPRLSDVGYGEYCEHGACAAVLDVLGGLGAARLTPADAPAPVFFPPEGASVNMNALSNEWPDPLSGCRGYSLPAGLPVTLQLGSMIPARLQAFSLRRDSAVQILEACGFDAGTYVNPSTLDQKAGREAMTELGAVVVVPRKPLEPGTYTVEMTINGHSYNWRFSVGKGAG